MPKHSLGRRRVALRHQNKDKTVFNLKSLGKKASVSVLLMETRRHKAVHQFSFGLTSTGNSHYLMQCAWADSTSAGAGSKHSAYTDYPINLNLILVQPTYRMSLIHSHLNANVVNFKPRDVLNPFIAYREKWTLLRCD